MVDVSDPFVIQRFLSHCDHGRVDQCWEWSGMMNTTGYGRFSLNDKHQLAHRVAYMMFIGAIPNGMAVCHRCDNRKCVNPHHLWLGTTAANIRDAVEKGRHVSPDTRGDRNGNRKLDWPSVRTIRAMHKAGVKKHLIAQSFGVTPSTIGNITNNQTWKEHNA